jgi:exopolysaccharide/PEP-CTERM locus tyrosine autokinase
LGFIDKALEKAKASKQKTGDGQDIPPARISPAEITPPLTGAHLPPEEIYYTITRTVPVRLEVLQRQRIITGKENDPVLEEYKILRTQILQRTKAGHHNTLMITGARPGEGKTLTAINLAISLAQEVDKTVLLVDADLRYPSVHEYFGLPRGPGLVDYLTGSLPLSQLLVHPEGFDKLVILPAGRMVAGAAELISSPMMADLVKELKQFYPDRYVLFDLPPLLSFADPLAFAPLVDGIMLVVEMGKTAREDIQKCVELLKDFSILGLVLNKVKKEDHAYYYYYHKNNEKPGTINKFFRWITP